MVTSQKKYSTPFKSKQDFNPKIISRFLIWNLLYDNGTLNYSGEWLDNKRNGEGKESVSTSFSAPDEN